MVGAFKCDSGKDPQRMAHVRTIALDTRLMEANVCAVIFEFGSKHAFQLTQALLLGLFLGFVYIIQREIEKVRRSKESFSTMSGFSCFYSFFVF